MCHPTIFFNCSILAYASQFNGKSQLAPLTLADQISSIYSQNTNSFDDFGIPGHRLKWFIFHFFCFELLLEGHKFSFCMPFMKIDQSEGVRQKFQGVLQKHLALGKFIAVSWELKKWL